MNIFVLTGAGVSAESGLGTFRDQDGLWSRFDPMKLATPEAFAHDPDQVHAFYNMRRQNLLSAGPNAAHWVLARLETGLAERGGVEAWRRSRDGDEEIKVTEAVFTFVAIDSGSRPRPLPPG
jgi:hypothetical protein